MGKITKEKLASSTVADVLILLVLYLIGIFIVNPVGNFPLNDDWSFARTVKRLLELHMYVPTGWTAMSLLTNTLWGSLFCLPLGFSFDALRISTLVAAFAGVVGVYFGAKYLEVGRFYRMIVALLLLFNPVYFALSHTFMTDVVFTVLVAISSLFFFRYLKYEAAHDLIFAVLFSLAATLSRQLGLAIPLAFAFSYLLLRGVGFKFVARALIPLIICTGALVSYLYWLSDTGRMTAIYSVQNGRALEMLRSPKLLLLSELINSYAALVYLGLFLLPVLLVLLPVVWKRSKFGVRGIYFSAFFVGLSTYVFSLFFGEPIFPLRGNILASFGIGPLTLRDTYILGVGAQQLPGGFWSTVTYLSLFGATLLLAFFFEFCYRLASGIWRRNVTPQLAIALFFWMSALIYLSVIFTSILFDRYLLPVMPLLSLAVLSTFSGDRISSPFQFKGAGVLCILAFAAFSICSTRDYLTWNRVRWHALNDLINVQKVERHDIDGGFEFNGFYLYERSYRSQRDKSWWWVEGDTYMISFNPIPGYTTIKEYPYSHWLPRYEGKILVSKKEF